MAAERAGLRYGRFTEDGLTFDTLRHTAATLMLDLAIATGKNKRVMGHTSEATTEKYQHLKPEKERPTVEALSAAMPLKDVVTAPSLRASKRGNPWGPQIGAAPNPLRKSRKSPKTAKRRER